MAPTAKTTQEDIDEWGSEVPVEELADYEDDQRSTTTDGFTKVDKEGDVERMSQAPAQEPAAATAAAPKSTGEVGPEPPRTQDQDRDEVSSQGRSGSYRVLTPSAASATSPHPLMLYLPPSDLD